VKNVEVPILILHENIKSFVIFRMLFTACQTPRRNT